MKNFHQSSGLFLWADNHKPPLTGKVERLQPQHACHTPDSRLNRDLLGLQPDTDTRLCRDLVEHSPDTASGRITNDMRSETR